MRSAFERTLLKILACTLTALLFLAPVPRALANPGGVLYTFGSTLGNNESKYSLYYTIPSVVHTGVKTNFTFYVYLTELSGWKYDSERQYLTIIINTPTSTVATQKMNSTTFLYQGGRLGPFNMTFEVSDSQVGLSSGRTTNATAYANLVVYEHYDNPLFPVLADDGATMKLTDFRISSGGAASSGANGHRVLVSLAIGAVVVVALTGVVLVNRRSRLSTRILNVNR